MVKSPNSFSLISYWILIVTKHQYVRICRYHGEKLVRYGPSAAKKKKQRITDGAPFISSVYDNPADMDPPEPLYTRNHPHHITYRDGLQFKKATDNDS